MASPLSNQTMFTSNLAELVEAALSARGREMTPGTSDPPARFSVLLGDQLAPFVAARLRNMLPSEPIDLSPVSGDEAVLTFTNRTFPLARVLETAPAAYELARVLAKSLGLRFVQPDLPRPSAPSRLDTGDGAKGIESVDNFPPGCWGGAELELNERPHWALESMRLFDAWKFSDDMGRRPRGEGIVIAQPDTGITHHPRLNGIVLAGGFNTLGDRPGNDPIDPLDEGFALNPGHGTSTGSVALSREALEEPTVVGSAPLARHIPIRAVRSVWLHEEIPIARAVDIAVEAGAHVVTMSLGGPTMPFSPLRAAIQRAVARHVIVMAAAGNCVDIVVYPARFSECLAVAGTNAADRKWPGSCSGPSVTVSAPAQNVFRASVSPEPDGSVGQGQGTSFAVALTAGVAACWLAHHGREMLIQEAEKRQETLQTMFRRLLRATARIPDGWDGANMGAGIVDARALLEASLDLGRGFESPAFEAETHGPADETRVFLTELMAEDPGLSDDFLLDHGMELTDALLLQRLKPSETPSISPSLDSLLTGPARKALGLDRAAALPPSIAAPAFAPTASRVVKERPPIIQQRIELVKRSLAMGKAFGGGASLESAVNADSNDLPKVSDLNAHLDGLLDRMPADEVKDRAAFERAVELLRTHGSAGIAKLPDPAADFTGIELGALEAVVKADGSRPSLMTKNGWIEESHPFIGGWVNPLIAARTNLRSVITLCGRIQPSGGHARRYCGSATLVDAAGPWVLSNFHVLAQAIGSYPVLFVRTARGMTIAGGLEIDFLAETNSVASNRWTIVEALLPDQVGQGFGFMDAVLFRLGRSLDNLPLPSGVEEAPRANATLSSEAFYLNGERPDFVTIGFPAKPLRTVGTEDGIDWGWVVAQLFGNSFGVKRLAPGLFFRGLGSEEKDAKTRLAFGHDATTLAGASGSLLYAFKDAGTPAFGLHFAGFDNDSNYAIQIPKLKESFQARGVNFL
jgi:hypothetical protein